VRRVSGCRRPSFGALDLIRIPGPRVWVEWRDSAALLGTREYFGDTFDQTGHRQRRAGAMLCSNPSGQSDVMHTVWADADQEPLVAAVDVHPEFNPGAAQLENRGDIFFGGWAAVTAPDPYVAQLLDCARYQFESSWGRILPCHSKKRRSSERSHTFVAQLRCTRCSGLDVLLSTPGKRGCFGASAC
jgi:hypothetical protein